MIVKCGKITSEKPDEYDTPKITLSDTSVFGEKYKKAEILKLFAEGFKEGEQN